MILPSQMSINLDWLDRQLFRQIAGLEFPCGCVVQCTCDWDTIGKRTMAKVPVQRRTDFYLFVRNTDGMSDLYARDQNAAVREFLGPTFDLIRLPVGV